MVLLLWIFFILCLSLLYCLVCVMQSCGLLLGKSWLLGSPVSDIFVYLSLSHKISWVRCGTSLYRFKIFASFPTLHCIHMSGTWNIGEQSGSVVECLTWDRGAAAPSLTSVTVLCPWARHIYPCLVLVQPWTTCPDITEKVLTGT